MWLVALNACDDEWLVAIKKITRKTKDINEGEERGEEKKSHPIHG